MVIDIHAHLAFHKIYPNIFMDGISDDIVSLKNDTLDVEATKSFIEKVLPNVVNDADCTKLIKQMDEAGIDKTVLLILDMGYELGELELSIEDIHKFHHNVLMQYPDRLIIFSGIDPRRGKRGYDLFEISISSYNFKGLKLFPPCGYELNDPLLYPYYEICRDYDIPVLIHTGPALKTLKKETGYPESILEIAENFSEIKFILGHAGAKDFSTGLMLAKERENIYLDIAGFQIQIVDIAAVKEKVRILCNLIPDKVLFGTGWPMFMLSGKQKRWVEFIEGLNVCSNENLEKLMYKNAKAILRI